MALRWKKDEPLTGLAAVGAGPRGSTLRDCGVRYATVQPLRHGHRILGWYWVAGWNSGVPHKNTHYAPCIDEASAKAEAMAYVKKHLATPSPQALSHDIEEPKA